MSKAASRRRGAFRIGPLLLLTAGLLLLLLAWVLWSGEAAEPAPLPSASDPALTQQPPVQPAQLGNLEPGRLPGEGDLLVEMRWRGGHDDTRETPELPGRLEGLITGADGQPVVGARVSVRGGPQDGRFVRSDAAGFYSFGQLLAGTHFFALDGAGLPITVAMQRVLARGVTRRDFAVGGAVQMRLLVKDFEGKPLAGAQVLSDLGERQGISDENGLAVVDGVPAGPRVLVDLRAAGHVPVRYELNLHGGLLGPIELPALPKAGTLRVAVRSWPGGPQPQVTVVPRATGPGPYQPAWELWQGLEVDRDGFVELTGLPTTHLLDVRVIHPMGTADPPVRALRPAAEHAVVAEFVVRRSSASIEGLVLDETGAPLEGATAVLAAVRPDLVLQRLYPGLSDSPTSVPLPVPGAMRRTIVTGADGRFRIAVGDHPDGTGHLVLTVSKEGFRPRTLEVRTAADETVLTLTRAVRASSLRLVRGDGGALPPARFVLDGAEAAASADQLGELWPGFYEVLVTRGGLQLLYREAFWIEAATNLDLTP
jgi:hypothetical protein